MPLILGTSCGILALLVVILAALLLVMRRLSLAQAAEIGKASLGTAPGSAPNNEAIMAVQAHGSTPPSSANTRLAAQTAADLQRQVLQHHVPVVGPLLPAEPAVGLVGKEQTDLQHSSHNTKHQPGVLLFSRHKWHTSGTAGLVVVSERQEQGPVLGPLLLTESTTGAHVAASSAGAAAAREQQGLPVHTCAQSAVPQPLLGTKI